MFWENFERIKRNIIFITQDEQLTYSDIRVLSEQIGDLIKKRSLIFFIFQNNIESILSYIAVMEANSVPLLLNFDISKVALLKLMKMYHPNYIFCDEKRKEEIADGEVEFCFRSYRMIRICNTPCELHEDLALLLSTSGSTGSSKLVRLSYSNILHNANAIADFLNISSHDITITTLPMSYTYGLSIINSHLIRGATIVVTNLSMLHQGFWKLFFNNNVCSFGGVPFIYEILRLKNFWNKNLENLRYMTVSGGRMSSDLLSFTIEQCEKYNIQFFQMYGQTEATARISYLPSKLALSKKGSIGKALEGGRMWIETDGGIAIRKPFTVGNLMYKGKNVCLGYAEELKDLSKGNENRGLLKTGDLAYFDDDGFFYLKGRKNRLLKIYGIRINLDELEELLDKNGLFCICTGEDDRLGIFTTDRDNIEKINCFIQHMTNIPKTGYKSIYIENIPHKSSGKIDYKYLHKYMEI